MGIERGAIGGRRLPIDVGCKQRFEVATLSHHSPLIDRQSSSHSTIVARRRAASPRRQAIVQHPAAARDARHHRPDRHVDDPRDLGVAEFLDVAQPDRLPERLRQLVERRLQIGVERRPRQQLLRRPLVAGGVGRPLDGLAVDVDRIAAVVPAHVAERVVEDREQPRLQVGAPLELPRGAKRLQVRVLDQILRVLRLARQPQSRAIEAVDVRQGLVGERAVVIRIPAIREARNPRDQDVGQRPCGRYTKTPQRPEHLGDRGFIPRLYSMADAIRSLAEDTPRTPGDADSPHGIGPLGRGHSDCSGGATPCPPDGVRDGTVATTVLATVTSGRAGLPLSVPR